jgi:AcrR family transcriptional regulator
MNVNQEAPSQAEATPPENRNAARSSATRAKLLQSARALFAKRGFAAVATEEIVRAAGITRGALYHHFRDKEDLFLAVYEQVESELAAEISQAVLGTSSDPQALLAQGAVSSPWDALERGSERFLQASAEPEVQRIALIDAPAVLGWETWREVGQRYGLGLIEAALAAAIDAGELDPQPIAPLAHMLLGAIDELALMVARAEDQPTAQTQASAACLRLLRALRR